MEVNWDAIGAFAELVGSLSVLITLIYIGVQVRDSKRMNELALRESRTANIAARVVDNPHLAKTLAKIRQNSLGHPVIEAAMKEWQLDAEEAELWFRYMGSIYRGLEDQYIVTGDVGIAGRLLSNDRLGVFYFQHAQSLYDPSFIEAIATIHPDILERTDT
jgi:hypothetical protein